MISSKFKMLLGIVLACALTACGDEASRKNDSRDVASENRVAKGHFFNAPYKCRRTETKKSKRTGDDVTRHYVSYYHPAKGWRIEFLGVKNTSLSPANLYTPEARYDGTFKARDGNVLSTKFVTKWPHTKSLPNISLSSLSKYKKKNCKLMSDLSIFEIDYLDKTKIMGE